MSAQLFSFQDGKLAPLAIDSGRPLRWAAWHPSGDWCLLAGNGGSALRYDAASGALRPIATGTKRNLRGAAFSPDGARALLVGNQGAVFLYDGSTVEAVAAPTSENLRRVAWRPGGDEALIAGNAGVVLRYEGGALTPVPGDRAHTLRTVAWRPDGAYALAGAYASAYAGYPRPHALYKCDGLYLQALLTSDDQDDIVAIDWHPRRAEALIAGYAVDGERAANKLIVYDGHGFSYRPVETPGALLGAAWAPDGSHALLCGEGGTLLRYDGAALEPIETGTGENLVGPFWRPDGALALFLRGPSERVYTV